MELLTRLTIAFYSVVAVLLAYRFVQREYYDGDHSRCNSLLQAGGYFHPAANDSSAPDWARWQPDGCLMYDYAWSDVRECMQNSRIVFAGDSIVRYAFKGLLGFHNDTLAESCCTGSRNDFDVDVDGVRLLFFWDPHGNYSRSVDELNSLQTPSQQSTDLFFYGTGLWHAQDHPHEIYLQKFAEAVGPMLHLSPNDSLASPSIADVATQRPAPWVVQPVQIPVLEQLSSTKRKWYNIGMAEAMNDFMTSEPIVTGGVISWSLNDMVSYPGAQWDGLHNIPEIDLVKVNTLLNYHCNAKLSSLDSTSLQPQGQCCVPYPTWSWPQWLILLFLLISILAILKQAFRPSSSIDLDDSLSASPTTPTMKPMALEEQRAFFSLIRAYRDIVYGSLHLLSPLPFILIYVLIADRSFFFAKRAKLFNAAETLFAAATVIAVACASLQKLAPTMESRDKHAGMFRREHIAEFKGFLVALLMILEWQAPGDSTIVRGLFVFAVAAFTFLLGYGNAIRLLQTSEFQNLWPKLVHFNFLSFGVTFVLSGGSSTLLATLAFSALLLCAFATIHIGEKRNDNPYFYFFKLIVSFSIVVAVGINGALGGPDWSATLGFETLTAPGSSLVLIGAFYVGLCCSFVDVRGQGRALKTMSIPAAPLKRIPSNDDGVDYEIDLDDEDDLDPAPRRSPLRVFAYLILLVLVLCSPAAVFSSINRAKSTAICYLTPLLVLIIIGLRSIGPSAQYHSAALSWLGRHALEVFVLRQHLWMAADGTAVLHLGLLKTPSPTQSPAAWLAFDFAESAILFGALLCTSAAARIAVRLFAKKLCGAASNTAQ